MKKRSLLPLTLAAALLAAGAATVAAEDYPNRPISLVVNFGAGGSTDVSARLLAERLAVKLSVPVTVENRGGGGGATGIGYVSRSNPDGYTIGTITASPVTTLYYTQEMGFHPINDLTFLGQYATTYHPLMVSSDSSFETLQDFIDHARDNPGRITYATAGTLNQPHLAIEQLSMAEDIELNYVPYSDGGAAAMTALLGGHIDAVAVSDFASHLRAGTIRMLVETGEEPITGHPDVPTFKSLGYDFSAVALVGIIAPSGLETDVAATLESALMGIFDDVEFQEELARLNMTPIARGGEEFRAYAERALESTGRALEALQSDPN